MKKLALSLVLVACFITTAAEFQFPGWKCTNVVVLQEQLALAPTVEMRIFLTNILFLVQNPPADFNDVKTAIRANILQIKPETAESVIIERQKQYAYNTGKFIAEAWQLCKASPGKYDNRFLLDYSPESLGETIDSYCEAIYQKLRSGIEEKSWVKVLVNLYCSNLPLGNLSREERYQKLQLLDDVYTARLVEDKAAWGDVIAQIRTIMDRYKQ